MIYVPQQSCLAKSVRVSARGNYLPTPYDKLDSEVTLGWEVPRYLELLTEERSAARHVVGRMAAALAATFAGLMIASLRLAAHFTANLPPSS